MPILQDPTEFTERKIHYLVTNAFQDVSKFYGIKPIVEFGIRAGVCEQFSDGFFEQLAENPLLAERQIEQITRATLKALQQRQVDLSRFSAQIKMDMCVQFGRASNQFNLNGSFVDMDRRKVTFNDVAFDHFDYFKEILLDQEKFKFRQSTHKYQPKLIDDVKNKCLIIAASFILADQNINIRTEYAIYTMDDAIRALKEERLDKNTLHRLLNNDFISSAKEKLLEYEMENKQLKLAAVLHIMNGVNIHFDGQEDAYKRLEGNIELQDAMIELDRGCTQLSTGYNPHERDALLIYKTNTIALALQGSKKFKENYGAIEAQAIERIDHMDFIKLARAVGNLLVLAFATFSIAGVIALALTSGSRGGFLLFKGSKRDFSTIVPKFDDINDIQDSERSSVGPNIGPRGL